MRVGYTFAENKEQSSLVMVIILAFPEMKAFHTCHSRNEIPGC